MRTDPLGGRKVAIADDRGDRPGAFAAVNPAPEIDPESDPFLEGHEDRTPPELWALRPDGGDPDGPGWLVRAVPNLYPVFATDAAAPPGDPNPDLFSARAADGNHEVIVNSPKPLTSLADLEPDELEAAVAGWRERMRAHGDAACRHLFVNEGRFAGASLPHTHAQLVALGFVPRAVAREREAFTAHAERTAGANLLSEILLDEVRRRERIVLIDEESVLLAPWASSVAFQLMLIPRDGRALFEGDGASCSAMLGRALGLLVKRFGSCPPLNLWVRTRPAGASTWTWRIDILPRLAQPAGIELGVGLGVNPIAPERAAAELRELAG